MTAVSKIGRFTIERELGAGAMGIVLAAHDPELGRRIALKILRSGGDTVEQARLLKEARAMAKVRHQNLVSVFEVGTHEDEVFIAMEYVEAGSIKAWAEGGQRTWKEILDVYLGAGEGLAAIHAAGLVHRDFKPDNVLIGTDGRPQVADFGLAKAADAHDKRLEHEFEVTDPGRAPPELATRTGTFRGTPAYMAPERWGSGEAGPASDQFSFCVSLYETLYGRRPFGAESIPMLARASANFERAAPPSSPAGRIPAWLRRVIERGLACDPAERYASMRELIGAVNRGRVRSRNAKLGLAAVGGAAVSGAVLALAPTENPCDHVDEAIAEDWSPERRAAIGKAFDAVEIDLSRATWALIEPRLDAYVKQWREKKQEVCRATLVRHEQAEVAFDLRMRCLDRRRAELAALLQLFEDADRDLVTKAAKATDALTELEGCDDVKLLAAEKPLPDDPGLRERVIAWRALIPELKAYADAGRVEAGTKKVDEFFDEVMSLDYKPTTAEAYFYRGLFALEGGRTQEGVTNLEQAFDVGLAAGILNIPAHASGILVHAVGDRLGDYEGAQRWIRLAASAAEAWGNQPKMFASLEINIGVVESSAGHKDLALEHFKRALQIYEEEGMGDTPEAANALMNLGLDARERGHFDEAREYYERAGKIFETQLGADHPHMGSLHNSIGNLYFEQGNREAAEVEFRTSTEILRRLVPANHPALGHPINNMGEFLLQGERYDEAIESFGEALGIWESAHGESHPLVAYPLSGRGIARLEQGKLAEARADLERAFAIRKDLPPDVNKGRTAFALARATADEDPTRAEELARLARECFPPERDERTEIDAWLAARAAARQP